MRVAEAPAVTDKVTCGVKAPLIDVHLFMQAERDAVTPNLVLRLIEKSKVPT